MKKVIVLIISVVCLLSACGSNQIIPTNDETNYNMQEEPVTEEQMRIYDEEILFRDIPWGTSYSDVDVMLEEMSLMGVSGEGRKTYSVEDIILGDGKGIDFEYNDIKIIALPTYDKVDVAGYKTEDIMLFFSYMPVDGVLTRLETDSALYGAQYEFQVQNLEEMSQDLVNKLSSLYGEPAKTVEEIGRYDIQYTYIYWYGINDTVLVLRTQDVTKSTSDVFDNQIFISYVWLKGDEMLQEASDLSKQEVLEKEAEAYGNDSTGGL